LCLVGGVVDDAAYGGEGVVGTHLCEGSAVEAGHRPAEGEQTRSVGGRGGGIAPGVEDAGAGGLEVEEEVGVVGCEKGEDVRALRLGEGGGAGVGGIAG
jgi:hypothetical protein